MEKQAILMLKTALIFFGKLIFFQGKFKILHVKLKIFQDNKKKTKRVSKRDTLKSFK